jgi:hypothetical protein
MMPITPKEQSISRMLNFEGMRLFFHVLLFKSTLYFKVNK